MTVAEAARMLEVSADLVYRLCADGRLAHRRIGLRKGRGMIRIDEAALADYLKSCEVSASPDRQTRPPEPPKPTGSGRPDGKPIRSHWTR